jgi:hypothetical protein
MAEENANIKRAMAWACGITVDGTKDFTDTIAPGARYGWRSYMVSLSGVRYPEIEAAASKAKEQR